MKHSTYSPGFHGTGPDQADYDQLEDFFENCPVGLHIVASDGTILRANKAELALLGYSAEEYIGHQITEFHADKNAIREILWRLRRGHKLNSYSARLRAKDGSIKYVEITSNAQFRDGQFVSTRCLTVDLTDARLAERRLREQERQSQQLLDALPVGIYTTDADGRVTYCNKAAAELAGRRPEINQDKWCVTWRLYWPDGSPMPLDECPMAVALQERRPVRGREVIAERPDGTRVPVIPFPTPLWDDDGKLVGAANMLVDISERKKAEETRELLIGELNHRVKNTLATVQAIAKQTLRHTSDPEKFVAGLTGRIQALARAHTLLAANAWKGTDVAALMREQIGAASNARVAWSGPAISLDPQTALNVALILHELATNARTFGALAASSGRLNIEWSLEVNGGRTLHLKWFESGSPAGERPSKRGFGTKLIDQIARASGGDAHMVTNRTDGVDWDIRLALPVEPEFDETALSSSDPPSAGSNPDYAILQGHRVLIIEDEPLIALELSQMLTDAGLEVAGIARTPAQAQHALNTLEYSAVVLDANLGGKKVDDLAAALARRHVPFTFVSGYSRESLPSAFRHKTLVAKPFTSRQVLNALVKVMSEAGGHAANPHRADELHQVEA